jgi:hypothetical protein
MNDAPRTIPVQENEYGDLYIELPQDVLDAANLGEGDSVEWIDNGDGSWTLRRKEVEAPKQDTKWVLVETVSQFRVRYMIEVGENDPAEWALDTVVMNEAKEFSQEHLGETIVSQRVVSQDEALALFDRDNDYLVSWSEDMKIRNAFTRIGESRDTN